MISFTEYYHYREGLSPVKPPARGIPRINTTPFTQAQRRKMVPPSRPSGPAFSLKPAITAVIPPKLIPQVKPGVTGGPLPAGVVPGSWFLP